VRGAPGITRTEDRTIGIVIALLAAIILGLLGLITFRGEDASNSAIERAISS